LPGTGTPLGDVVGFKIRFQDRLSAGASVKLMTDGILLAETQSIHCCAPTTR
jgi:ATP-dependent helicase HrpA